MKHRFRSGGYLVTGMIVAAVIVRLLVYATAQEEPVVTVETTQESVIGNEDSLLSVGEEPRNEQAGLALESSKENQTDGGGEPLEVEDPQQMGESEEVVDTDHMFESETDLFTDQVGVVSDSETTKNASELEMQNDTQESQELDALQEAAADHESDTEEPGSSTEEPPAWVTTDEVQMNGSLAVALELLILDNELSGQTEVIRQAFAMSDAIAVQEEEQHLAAILGIYALKYDLQEDFPSGIEIEGEAARKALRSIYWEATRATGTSIIKNGAEVAVIQIERSTPAELAKKYQLNEEDTQWLTQVSESESEALMAALVKKSILRTKTKAELADLVKRIPATISTQRRAVLLAALSQEGTLPGQWSGMAGSEYISWAFVQGSGDEEIASYIGTELAEQWSNSYAITMDELIPGDLVFRQAPEEEGDNLVGIVLGFGDDGEQQVIQLYGSSELVEISPLQDYEYARRPYIYKD